MNDIRLHHPEGKPPMQHQIEAFQRQKDEEYFALFGEQGTGKTAITLWTFQNQIEVHGMNAAIVFAPLGVHGQWADEVADWVSPDLNPTVHVWRGLNTVGEQKAIEALYSADLPLLFMNIDAISHDKGIGVVRKFLQKRGPRRVFGAVDESSRIKTPGARRTKRAINIMEKCGARRILTGTPITKDYLDLYSQYRCLHPDITGANTFAEFKAMYAVYELEQMYIKGKRRDVPVLVDYKNIDKLRQRCKPWTWRKLKKDCMDLPARTFTEIRLQMTPDMKRAYKELEQYSMTVLEGELTGTPSEVLYKIATGQIDSPIMTAKNAAVMLMRMIQITGGFDNSGRALAGANPKLSFVEDALAHRGGKLIIWAAFTEELKALHRIASKYGKAAVYYGGTGSADRDTIRHEFENGDLEIFIGQPAAGGIGLTLNQGTTMIYYSRNYRAEDRWQSLERNYRIGQSKPVTVIDLVMEKSADEYVLQNLDVKAAKLHGMFDNE